jgi:hypothetical protein
MSTATLDPFYRDSNPAGTILVSRVLAALYRTALQGFTLEQGFDIMRVKYGSPEADVAPSKGLSVSAAEDLDRKAWDLVLLAARSIRRSVTTCQVNPPIQVPILHVCVRVHVRACFCVLGVSMRVRIQHAYDLLHDKRLDAHTNVCECVRDGSWIYREGKGGNV